MFNAKQALPIANGSSFIVNLNNRRLKFLYARVIFVLDVLDCLYEVCISSRFCYREIREPKNVKLVIDVIQYDLPPVKRALLFACGNSLVCETVDDARKVAFGMQDRHKVSVSKCNI